jgi:hypothetical protein
MPTPMNAAILRRGLLDAHELGLEVGRRAGDESFRRLHG